MKPDEIDFFRKNEIHRTAVIGTDVEMGFGNTVGPYAVITGPTIIGNGNQIRAHAVIGSPAEKFGFFRSYGAGLRIGDRNIISEHVTIHAGTDSMTTIGDDCVLLTKSHLGHDSVIGNGANISCSVMVGGHSLIGKGANIGLAAVLHQYSRIGSWAMIGANSFVKRHQKIIPGCTYVGSPARFVKNNTVGLQRSGISQEQLQFAIVKYREATKDWADE